MTITVLLAQTLQAAEANHRCGRGPASQRPRRG